MDRHRQYGKQPNKKTDIRKYEKDGSTKKQEKGDQIRCGLALCSFKDEDERYIDSGSSHHMIGDKSKMESLMKNHHGNDILGTNVSTKVLGLGTVKTDSRGTENMKF